MGRWFRVYDETLHDPKVLRLPDAMRWHWIAVLCIASKNDGALPSTSDMAIELRTTPSKVSTIIATLKQAELLDYEDGVFFPHNWSGRQYKSDTSNERVKRYRNAKRNVTDVVTVTPPDTEQKQITETEQKEPAVAARDPRSELFSSGVAKLKAMTGKGDNACRSFIGKCLKVADDEAVAVLGAIEEAERNRVADAGAWIMASIQKHGPPPAKPLTPFQQKQAATNDILNRLGDIANGNGSGAAIDRILSGDQRQQPGNLRGGASPVVLSLPGTSRS
jgi:hypothetical protein